MEAIKKLKPPTTIKGFRQFLGMTNFYRKFVKNYAEIVQPLTALTGKYVKFSCSPEAEKAFQTLKEKLQQAPILTYPDVNKPYRLYCDASNIGTSTVLVQLDSEGWEHVIQYVSHRFSPAQLHWPMVECEAFTIIYDIQQMRMYLYGSKFVYFTDHKPLKFIFESWTLQNAKVQ